MANPVGSKGVKFMFKLKKEIKKEYPYMSDAEFNLIWSFMLKEDIVVDFLKNQFENKLRRFR